MHAKLIMPLATDRLPDALTSVCFMAKSLCLWAAVTAWAFAGSSATSISQHRFRLDCKHCPVMQHVAGGYFRMGGTECEIVDASGAGVPAEWLQQELPQRQVKVGSFWVSRAPVSRGEFRVFVKATGYVTQAQTDDGCPPVVRGRHERPPDWQNPGFAQSETDPVVCVSHIDAMRYVVWLQRLTGQPYRLLSESEFEYLAHQPDDVRHSVQVWVGDCFHSNYVGAPLDSRAWTTGCSKPIRHMARGGWDRYDPAYTRAAFRGVGFEASYREPDLGFRVAKDAP